MTEPFDAQPSRAEQERAEAAQLYRLAADQGVAGAQCRMGVVYAEGRGVPQDDAEAVRWFHLAADQGDAEAQGGLGFAYGAGRGVKQDFVASHMWLTLSIAQLIGPTRHAASKFRDTIAAAMTSAQLADAECLAREWKPIAER